MNLDSSKNLIVMAMAGRGREAAAAFSYDVALEYGLKAEEARSRGDAGMAAFCEQQADTNWARGRDAAPVARP